MAYNNRNILSQSQSPEIQSQYYGVEIKGQA